MEGKVLVVNKPRGPTSHDVVKRVKKLCGARKAGHAGTLDPMATGVLIVLLDQATKRQAEFMGLEKEYEAEITFGAETDTYDAEGEIKRKAPSEKLRRPSEKEVRRALEEFVGEIEQTVPPYSAVKVGGRRLYRLAREGTLSAAQLPKRRVLIKKIELLDFNPPKARLRVVCSKGTYIRSLVHDLGRKLGGGAFLSGLVRTRIGPHRLEKAASLNNLESGLRG